MWPGPRDSLDVFDLLSSLVDKSLVILQRERSSGRYQLLETLRQYGAERLGDHDEIQVQRTRHLAHYTAVAEQARKLVQGDSYERGTELFEQEWDNLRAALSWALESGHEPAACTLTVAPPLSLVR